MSFRWQLFYSYLALCLLLVLGLFAAVDHLLLKRLTEESRENLLNQARLAVMLTERDGAVQASPQDLAREVGTAIKARLTLIAADGRVLGDSGVSDDHVPRVDNHAGRSEVREAMTAGSGSSLRYSSTLRTTMLYVALRCPLPDGSSGVLRLALPLERLDAAKRTLHTLLGGTVLLLILAALLLSVVFSNVTSRPLREIADAAARIGVGEKGVRIALAGRSGEIGYLAQVLNDMAGRIEQQVHRISSEQQRLSAILLGMGEGVMVTDKSGALLLVNPAFLRMFGIRDDVTGRPLVEVCRHPDLLQAFETQRGSGEEMTCELTVPATNLVLLAHWVPLTDEKGLRQGTVAVFHDISDLKRLETMRRDFVANVSHELRTPVAVIKGYAETLLDGALEEAPDQARRFTETIVRHAERLTNLINDILTLSRLEGRDAGTALLPLEIGSVIDKVRQLMEDHAAGKGISLTVACPPSLPRVAGDQGQLEQVLLNLLDNALKYTPSGGRVGITARPDGNRVAIAVTDTGSGIPARDLSRIFERFYRVDEARSREQGGTGLGLAIVKHIVQLHGGEITVQSEPGTGSVFTLYLNAVSSS
ncbi:ATP-binding protein [Trichlorobacter ammonificans]|uniref:histidine kinase n=1 Tax=Trichlorobacter ammonificans TaxID=2916410 RepID=A0ABM9DAX2_9BACT|nr:ATP-binding protein [Trichlorobacter ammonificans]CAH2032383.1 Phosphate regulon sensor protein PhoR [Trichlorobacter ammonificans]